MNARKATHSNSKRDSSLARMINIKIRALRRQRDLIDRAAEALGKSRSKFMLEAACREAESVLIDKRVFVLDDDAYNRFVFRLTVPPKINRKLQYLLETKAPWIK